MRRIAATPPTTPPAMAPAFVPLPLLDAEFDAESDADPDDGVGEAGTGEAPVGLAIAVEDEIEVLDIVEEVGLLDSA